MPMRQPVRLYLASAALFLVIDAVWLGLVAGGFYRNQLGSLMREEPAWAVAALFYLVFVAGLLWFAVRRAGSTAESARDGALFGFFTYATYDLTNLATLSGWPMAVVAVDIAWGTALCATVAAVAHRINARLARTHPVK